MIHLYTIKTIVRLGVSSRTCIKLRKACLKFKNMFTAASALTLQAALVTLLNNIGLHGIHDFVDVKNHLLHHRWHYKNITHQFAT